MLDLGSEKLMWKSKLRKNGLRDMIVHNQTTNYKSLYKEGASGFRAGAAGEKWNETGGGNSKRA